MKASVPLILIVGLAAFLFFFRLGDRSLRNPDEGRYAEIAREMAQSGDWVVPRLYGMDYLRKPVLFYWLVAGSFKQFGFTEFAARLVPALFGILGILATYLFAARVFDRRTAGLSALMLAANLFYVQVGRYLLIDMVFSFFVVSSFYLFYLALTDEKRAPFYFSFFYVCLAMAFLTKGLAALALPAVSLTAYLVFSGKFLKTIRGMRPGRGLVIFLALTLPWFLQIVRLRPHFLRFFFLHEHLERFLSARFEHQESWFYYLLMVPLVFLPWTLFWEPLKNSRNEVSKYLCFSSAGLVLFFSLSRTKLPTYLLPVIPWLSIVIADGWRRWRIEETGRLRWLTMAFLSALGLAGLLLVRGAPVLFSRYAFDYPEGLVNDCRWAAAALAAGTGAALFFLAAKRVRPLLASLVVTNLIFWALVTFAIEKINPNYSTRAFAETLRPGLRAGDTVFIYDHPGAFYDFQFYLGRPVKLVGLAGEFELLKDDKNARASSVTHREFEERLERGEPMYCLMRKSDYEGMDAKLRQRLRILKEDPRKVLAAVP